MRTSGCLCVCVCVCALAPRYLPVTRVFRIGKCIECIRIPFVALVNTKMHFVHWQRPYAKKKKTSVRKMQSYPGLVNIKWNLLLTFFVQSAFLCISIPFQFFFSSFVSLCRHSSHARHHEWSTKKKKKHHLEISVRFRNLSWNRNECCVFVFFFFLTFYQQR